jgi:hypothetical protein
MPNNEGLAKITKEGLKSKRRNAIKEALIKTFSGNALSEERITTMTDTFMKDDGSVDKENQSDDESATKDEENDDDFVCGSHKGLVCSGGTKDSGEFSDTFGITYYADVKLVADVVTRDGITLKAGTLFSSISINVNGYMECRQDLYDDSSESICFVVDVMLAKK